jgi:hypothetical protein
MHRGHSVLSCTGSNQYGWLHPWCFFAYVLKTRSGRSTLTFTLIIYTYHCTSNVSYACICAFHAFNPFHACTHTFNPSCNMHTHIRTIQSIWCMHMSIQSILQMYTHTYIQSILCVHTCIQSILYMSVQVPGCEQMQYASASFDSWKDVTKDVVKSMQALVSG